MKKLLILAPIALLAIGLLFYSNSMEAEQASAEKPVASIASDSEMVAAAKALLNGLSPELKKAASYAFDADDREQWKFVPLDNRIGARLGNMNEKEQELTFALVQSGLSEAGYKIARDIMSLEDVLTVMEKREKGNDYRNPTKYFITIFGEPSMEKPWAWKYEGHHLSLNYSSVSGKLSVTPAFMGTNPAEVPFGEDKGKRVLGHVEDMGRALIKSMSSEQLAKAIISEKAYPEIVTEQKSVAILEKFEGIPYPELNLDQQKAVLDLIHERLNIMKPEVAKVQWQKIQDRGLDKLFFAWAGGLEPGQLHYYRIHGPATIIEYDNAQNDGKHAHLVWRDTESDFGRDLLKEHHLKHEH